MPLSDGLDTRPCKILDPRLLSVTSRYSIQGSELVFGIGNESVPRIIINDAVNLFFKPVSILLISNPNSFRVLFDKIASVYFISKMYLYFGIGNGRSPGNQHCANCIDILSFPTEAFFHLSYPRVAR